MSERVDEAMRPERIEGLHVLSGDLSEYRRSFRQADQYLIGSAIEAIDDSINEIVRQNRELDALRAQNETLAAIVRDVAAMNLEDVYICPACGFETSYRNLPEEHDGPCPYRRAVAWAREAGE